VSYQVTLLVKRIGRRQLDRRHSMSTVRVRHALVGGQSCMDKHRSGFVAKVFGLERPPLYEPLQVEAGGRPVFVEVQRRVRVRRIPAASADRSKGRIEGISPEGLGDSEPDVTFGKDLRPHQVCASPNWNILRHARRASRDRPEPTSSTNDMPPSRAVGIDLDATWTNAEFTDDDPAGNDIPGAIVTTVASGVTVSDLGRWFGALRLRYFSGGPLTEDGSVTWGPTALVSGRIRYNLSNRWQLVLDVFNLLGREDDDIAYYYASRLPGEPLDGIEDVHFHPMVKPSARVTMTWKF